MKIDTDDVIWIVVNPSAGQSAEDACWGMTLYDVLPPGSTGFCAKGEPTLYLSEEEAMEDARRRVHAARDP